LISLWLLVPAGGPLGQCKPSVLTPRPYREDESAPPRRDRRDIKPDRIRALELLASCDNGCPEGILHAHGFAINDMVELEPTREAAMAAFAKSWRRE